MSGNVPQYYSPTGVFPVGQQCFTSFSLGNRALRRNQDSTMNSSPLVRLSRRIRLLRKLSALEGQALTLTKRFHTATKASSSEDKFKDLNGQGIRLQAQSHHFDGQKWLSTRRSSSTCASLIRATLAFGTGASAFSGLLRFRPRFPLPAVATLLTCFA